MHAPFLRTTVPAALAGMSRATLPVRPGAPPAGERALVPEPARFEEQRELGRGGMGRVTLAHDRVLAREVAIKQALSDDPAFQLRFAREVRITARLAHPSIVPVHDAGLDAQGRPFYVMRRIEGVPLDTLVRACATSADRLALVPHVLAAADAAAYAHAHGILHRDIKPSNILVGSYGETWLIDWGLARDLADDDEAAGAAASPSSTSPRATAPPDSGLTQAGDVMGTPGFVAPEQARGEAVGVGADVYSLGATLAYVLTGRLLYTERAATGLLQRAAANAPIQLDALEPEIPPALLAIVRAATASRLQERYRGAAELATELRRFLTGQLVAAHRYSARERLRRFVRRHRTSLAIALVAGIALATVATASILQIIDERDRAAAAEARAVAQRALAEQRSELLLLERARMQVRTDPTAAVATLKALPAASAAWPAAWGIVSRAQVAGTASGLRGHQDDVFALEFSPDGTRLASGGNDGLVQVHEVASQRARTLAQEGQRVAELQWLDDGWLAYATADALVTVELDRGRAHRMPVKASSLHAAQEGAAVRYLADGALYQIDRTLGAAPLALGPARSAVAARAGSLVATGSELVWVDAAGHRSAIEPYHEAFLIAAVSDDARRLVISDLSTVRELELAPPAARTVRTWALPKVMALAYDSGTVCMSALRRSWRASPDGALSAPLMHDRQVRALFARPQGCVFIEDSGAAFLTSATRDQSVPLADRQIRRAAVSQRSDAFAVTTRGGGLEVWPMTWRPRQLPLRGLAETTRSLTLLAMTSSSLYFSDFEEVLEVDRATGETSPLTRTQLSSSLLVFEAGEDRLVMIDLAMQKVFVLDRAAARARQAERQRTGRASAPPPPLYVREKVVAAAPMDDPDHGWLLTDGATLRRLEPRTLRETAVMQLPEPVLAVAHNRGIMLARTRSTLHRVELATRRAQTLPLPDARGILVDGAGTAWVTTEDEVWRWDGHERRTLERGDVVRMVLHQELGVLVQHRSGKVQALSPAGEVTRTFDLPPMANLVPTQPFALWLDASHEHLVVGDLIGGERIEVPLTSTPATSFCVDDAGGVAVTTLFHQEALLFPPLPPLQRAELRAWLDKMTNAEPALAQAELRWRLPPALAPSP